MKNIIRSSAIILGVCVFAANADAQTLSSQPSQAERITAESKKTLAKQTPPVEDKIATVESDKTAVSQNNNIVPTPAVAPVRTEATKVPPISTQGVVAVKIEN